MQLLTAVLLMLMVVATSANPFTRWWRDCKMLDLTHELIHGEHAHALKAYKDNPVIKQPLINGLYLPSTTFYNQYYALLHFRNG